MKRVLGSPFKKNVGDNCSMYLCEMDVDLWNYFIKTNPVKPQIEKYYTRTYPDHGYSRKESFHIGSTANYPD